MENIGLRELTPGLTATVEIIVAPENTAQHVGSGSVAVLATPEMIRLMETAAVKAVDPLLPDGQRTVGVHLDVRHLAPTPLGLKVQARAELIAIEGRKLTFAVEAHDERELIGQGYHQRVIIDVARFLERARAKQE